MIHSIMAMVALGLLLLGSLAAGQTHFDYPSASLGSKWINNPNSMQHSVDFTDGTRIRAMLLKGSLGPRFACGFFCHSSSKVCQEFLFGVFIVQTNSGSGIVMPAFGFPQLVWSANRGRPVSENATIELRKNGDLVLTDTDGKYVWSSGTASKGVTGLSISEGGNLVLSDRSNTSVWQSFQNPTNSLLPEQTLGIGMQLVSDATPTNSNTGDYHLLMEGDGLTLYAADGAKNRQIYWKRTVENASFAKFTNRSLDLFGRDNRVPEVSIPIPSVGTTTTSQYLKLEADGKLGVHSWSNEGGWKTNSDIAGLSIAACSLPSACGHYGICTDDRECSCPEGFSAVDRLRPSKGCTPPSPIIKCGRSTSLQQQLLQMDGIDYFANDFSSSTAVTMKQCKASCLKNCSCGAAFYRNSATAADGSVGGECFIVGDVYTLRNSFSGPGYTSTAFIKLQNSTNASALVV